jgi:hypothetical protein
MVISCPLYWYILRKSGERSVSSESRKFLSPTTKGKIWFTSFPRASFGDQPVIRPALGLKKVIRSSESNTTIPSSMD